MATGCAYSRVRLRMMEPISHATSALKEERIVSCSCLSKTSSCFVSAETEGIRGSNTYFKINVRAHNEYVF